MKKAIQKLSDRQAILQVAATMYAADVAVGHAPEAEFRYVDRAMKLWDQVQDSCERRNANVKRETAEKRKPKRRPPAK